MITSFTKDGKRYDDPKEINVPTEKCKIVYKVIKESEINGRSQINI